MTGTRKSLVTKAIKQLNSSMFVGHKDVFDNAGGDTSNLRRLYRTCLKYFGNHKNMFCPYE